jgi:hypothetical protein
LAEITDPAEDISPGKFNLLKFASMTSCDMERSFSVHKRILSDRLLSITTENIKYLLVHCIEIST